ncbi:choice-of-anchor Q domain-containing protein [Sneathiella limimaris]|uniref:choice-of-anchor Q domain-containing protein n=1 Tax=Sneathiella limimaris TaxID=1964213 RepID=UPI00146B6DA6|nr:choice-of-anchor Q domain-containing protein [Sneathiella limimaris]
MFRILLVLTSCFSLYQLHPEAFAKEYFINPEPGLENNSQVSNKHTFQTIRALLRSGKLSAGDTVILYPGYYGSLELKNLNMSSETVFKSLIKHKAIFSQVYINRSSHITLSGIMINSDGIDYFKNMNLLMIEKKSSNISIENSLIQSAEDTTGWSKNQWNQNLKSGIFSFAENVNFELNHIRNVNFGISTLGKYSRVYGNTIEDFAGDGMRGLGDNSVFEKNIVKNCHSVNDNHDDGFQSWSTNEKGRPGAGAVRNVKLFKNLIIANTSDENRPYCTMQGIGLFGKTFIDWEIKNNVIVVDHWHGITVQGGKNVRILNNTVFDPNGLKPGPAWIRLTNSVELSPPYGNLVANNLSTAYNIPEKTILRTSNQLLRNPNILFMDPKNNDFRLKSGSRAIDAGMDGLGVTEDFDGNPRPSGMKTDVGAFEFQE